LQSAICKICGILTFIGLQFFNPEKFIVAPPKGGTTNFLSSAPPKGGTTNFLSSAPPERGTANFLSSEKCELLFRQNEGCLQSLSFVKQNNHYRLVL